MKKFMSVLLAAVLAFSMSAAVFAAGNGDIDNDGKVTASDARTILRAAVGLATLSAEKKQLADLDLDGIITAADARIALRIAVGLETAADKLYANEYEVLLGGYYCAAFTVTEYDGGQSVSSRSVKTAFTPKTQYFSGKTDLLNDFAQSYGIEAPADGISVSLLFAEDGEIYLTDNNMKLYGEFPFTELGMEPTEFTRGFDRDMFRFLRPLKEADSVADGVFNGVDCKRYTFKLSDGRYEAFLNGKKLEGIRRYNKKSEVTAEYSFQTVSLSVPGECTAIPASYSETDALELLLLLLMS